MGNRIISFKVTEQLHEKIMQAAEKAHKKRNRYIIDLLDGKKMTWNEFQHANKGEKDIKNSYKQYKKNQHENNERIITR